MDPFDKIPEKIASFILAQLYRALPPPIDDRPESLEARDLIAMAAIAKLGPVNTAEASLAVHAVAAQAHATDCLIAINENRDDFRRAGQCRAQSALMMRQSAQTLRELRELQERRIAAFAYRAAEIEAERRRVEAEAEAERENPAEVAEADRDSSPAPIQNPTQRKHETHSGIPVVMPRPSPSEAAQIAALVPGMVRSGGHQADLARRLPA